MLQLVCCVYICVTLDRRCQLLGWKSAWCFSHKLLVWQTSGRMVWHSNLTPSLPQPVKFPGWKMDRRICKKYFFWSCSTSTFSAVHISENPPKFHCLKEDKKAYGFQISLFYWLFLSDIMAVKGLISQQFVSACRGDNLWVVWTLMFSRVFVQQDIQQYLPARFSLAMVHLLEMGRIW